nr:non-ribosomal peptide synthetase [Clostridium estertheticum]
MKDVDYKYANIEEVSSKDIAIVGMSIRAPKANNIDEFWNNLINKVDCVRQFPQDRGRDIERYLRFKNNNTRKVEYDKGAYLDEIDKFDYRFFKMTPKDAEYMNPNQRLFLETTWEALEDAGYGGNKIAGSRTGIYVGYMGDSEGYKYREMLLDIDKTKGSVSVTGNVSSMIASRISYLLDLNGPSMVVDTACSSSLVAVHLACQSIRNNECDMSIVGGVKTVIFPFGDENKVGIESPDGKAKTFDDSANGTGVGEGVGVVVLKSLSRALKDKDNIYAVIKGTAINQDGNSVGISAPNVIAQENVILKAWKDAGINPETISYIEAHGTGTELGDPIEIEGIQKAFRRYTDKRQFCAIGALKTNIGHSYEVSGVMGLIKAVMSLKNKTIPPNIHFNNPNRKINFVESPLYVVDKLTEWQNNEYPRRCGVSSFGFSGTNAHVILEEAPQIKKDSKIDFKGLDVFTISAKSKNSLEEIIRRYTIFIKKEDEIELEEICYTSNTGRGHYSHRLAIVVRNIDELREKLESINGSGFEAVCTSGIYYGEHVVISSNRESKNVTELTQEEKRGLNKSANDNINELKSSINNEELLNEICSLYVKGSDIDWERIYENRQIRKVSLPKYAFEKERCWIEIPEFEEMEDENYEQIPNISGRKVVKSVVQFKLKGKEDECGYTALENEIGRVWCDVLGFKEINVYDSFYELGGDSISMMHIIGKVSNELGMNIRFNDFVENNSIVELVKALENNRDQGVKVEYPKVEPDPINMNKPFLLTDIQMAYLIGRNEQFELGGVSTHVYVELETKLNAERLNSSLKKVIDKHPMLRSIILSEGKQKILDEVPDYDMCIEDMRGINIEEKNKYLIEERDRMSHHICKTDEWPLFEFKMLKMSDEVSCLLIGIDMLIADRASLQIIIKELMEYYDNPRRDFKQHDFTFRDYMLAYDSFKNSETYMNSKEYWMNKLDEFPSLPALPLKQDPAKIKNPCFKRHSTVLDKEMWHKLKKKSKIMNITPSALLCTAYGQVLSYWSNQSRFAINLTVFNRYPFHKDVDKIIGDFTSVVLLDIDMKTDSLFWEKAKKVQFTLMEALEHRHYDGVEFIREIAKSKGLGTKAVMPVVFTSAMFGNEIEDLNKLGEMKMGISQTSQVYIDNQVTESNGELSITWDYVDGLFEQEVIDNMFEQFIGILSMLADTEDEYRFKLREEDIRLIEGYNRTEEYIQATTLQRLFMEQAKMTPNNNAITFEDTSITYKKLDRKSNQIAHYIRQSGLKVNDFVGVLAYRRIETIVNIMGILKAGGAYVPIDPSYPQGRKDYILSNSQCKMLMEPDFYEKKNIDIYSEDYVEDKDDIESIAYVIYTSGSTGKPKGVMVKHKAVTNTIIDINRKLNITEKDRIIGLSSMCFDLSVYDIFGTLSSGATLIQIEDQRDVQNILETVEKHKITIWNSVPAIMDMTVNNIYDNYKNTSLRCVLLSGDHIPLNLPNKIRNYFSNTKITSLGGATEASIWSIYYDINRVDERWNSIPYGNPLANQKFYVLNNEMNLCPPNVQGELYIGGAGVASGYCNDEDKTRNAFIAHSELGYIYKTGDYGVFRKEGFIEFMGRKDDQVKIRGYRIELGEIEKCIMQYEGIKDAIVIDSVSEAGKKYLCAYIVLNKELSINELKNKISESLPNYMIPGYFVHVDAIPLTSNGKVDKKALPKPNIYIKEESSRLPNNEVEVKLVEICKDLLKVENIGVTDNFFEAGGDSLLIQQLNNKVEQHFKVKLPIKYLFAEPTIEKMTSMIMEEKNISIKNSLPKVNVEEEERIFWSPVVNWTKVDKQVVIDRHPYSEFTSNLFPELYFLTQNGISLTNLRMKFTNICDQDFDTIVGDMIKRKIFVSSLLTPQQIFNTQDVLFKNTYSEDIMFNPSEYNKFKKKQLNRTFNFDTDKEVYLNKNVKYPEVINKRRSVRIFEQEKKISIEDLSKLLSIFKQNREKGNITYYFPSSGGLYPIDVYVYVKENRVVDIEEGLYYYNPIENKLSLVTEDKISIENSHFYNNKEVYKSSAISVFFIYNAETNMPKYGTMAYFYACVDSGIMISTLTNAAEMIGMGVCTVGNMNFESIKNYFKLNKNQLFLHVTELGLKIEQNSIGDEMYSLDELPDLETFKNLIANK